MGHSCGGGVLQAGAGALTFAPLRDLVGSLGHQFPYAPGAVDKQFRFFAHNLLRCLQGDGPLCFLFSRFHIIFDLDRLVIENKETLLRL